MKRRIEAGDLRKLRNARQQSADRREIVRLVKRSERGQAREIGEDLIVDQHRPVIVWAAMDHAMANRNRRGFCVSLSHADATPIAAETPHGFRCVGPVDQDRIVEPFTRNRGCVPMPSSWPLTSRFSVAGPAISNT